jgi:hypothetical protein
MQSTISLECITFKMFFLGSMKLYLQNSTVDNWLGQNKRPFYSTSVSYFLRICLRGR